MRITSGIFGGRTIKVPPGIRPTQDKVRQALFSSLGERIGGARVLDLFAGSGALGLEAWSRGAESVCFVESDARVFPILKENIKTLCGEQPALSAIRSDAIRFLESGRAGPSTTMTRRPIGPLTWRLNDSIVRASVSRGSLVPVVSTTETTWSGPRS